jgi:2-polyprenyl-3-methyl-5-hydroxy-6-metoxy-1,4-benzoquinol methylase
MGEDYSSREWFESLSWQHGWIEKMAGWWIGEFGKPRSVVDYGAGDGWWCKAFHDVGSTVWAVELHEIAREFIPSQVQFVQHDLTCPLEIVRRLDLVICLEVAEHIPERYADILCQTLAASTGMGPEPVVSTPRPTTRAASKPLLFFAWARASLMDFSKPRT